MTAQSPVLPVARLNSARCLLSSMPLTTTTLFISQLICTAGLAYKHHVDRHFEAGESNELCGRENGTVRKADGRFPRNHLPVTETVRHFNVVESGLLIPP